MSDLLTIRADATALVAAVDRLGDSLSARVNAAAKETADAIADEARRRVRRRTGRTMEMIRVEPTGDDERAGWIVRANDRATKKHIDSWLEFGTIHMTAKPFLFNSAALEEGNHYRRLTEAVQDAIDDEGLGR